VKARDYDCILLDFVPESERKLAQVDPPSFAENFSVRQRVAANPLNSFIDTREEFQAESLTLPFVPFNGPNHVSFGGGRKPDDQREAGRSSLRRISAFTSAQDLAAFSSSSSVRRRSARTRCVSSSISGSSAGRFGTLLIPLSCHILTLPALSIARRIGFVQIDRKKAGSAFANPAIISNVRKCFTRSCESLRLRRLGRRRPYRAS